MKKIGRYEILEELGRGAMGVVYKASDPTIGRLVAIKLLQLSRSAKPGLPGAKDIFLREARAAGRLSHPGIVTVHDTLEDPETQSCYIVMEFVAGRTLEKALLAGPPFAVDKALDIARQIGEALDYAHHEQIIHRDLKPANILLTEDGRAKITDFGIAKVVASEDAQRTLAIMGTPAYMSPEQVTGGDITAASDVFSLGILLYLMLTGEKPFSGDTAAVMFKIAYQDPAPPSQIKPELSRGHDFLLLRSLAKDRKKRYANAREFLDDLDDAAHGRQPRSESKVPMSELHAGDLTVHATRPLVPALKSVPVVSARKSGIAWGVAAAALLVLLAAGIWLSRRAYMPVLAPTLQTQAPPPPPTALSEMPAPPQAAAKKTMVPHAARPTLSTPEIPAAAPAMHPPPTVAQQTPPSTPLVPTELGKPAVAKRAAASPASPATQSTIQFYCRYEFEEATLTLDADGRTLLSETLKGKKTGRLLGLRHAYSGTLSRPVKIPSGARRLTIHIETQDGSVKLTRSIARTVPGGKASATLHVTAKANQLALNW